MSSTSKTANAAIARRKSNLKQEIKFSKIVTLKLSPANLRKFSPPEIKKEQKEDVLAEPSAEKATAVPVPPLSNGDKPSESNTSTPVASGTPLPTSSMPPPSEGVKKKGVKRSSTAALAADGTPKVRGKPGPKKRPRLEDGSIDHSNTAPRAAPGTAAHKLGPKANQGAINAGLRALDRSGKPCRKWTKQKNVFKLKSFTGVEWELNGWRAPPRVTAPVEAGSQSSPSDSSNKENKENKDRSQLQSEKNNNVPEVDKVSAGSDNPLSPTPSLPTAAPQTTVTDTPPADTPSVTVPTAEALPIAA